MDPTPTEKLTTTGQECSGYKINRLTTLLCHTKGYNSLHFLTHGNATVKSNLSENSRMLTIVRSLLSKDFINAIRLTKDVIGVT